MQGQKIISVAGEAETEGEAPTSMTTLSLDDIFNISTQKFLSKIKTASLRKLHFFTFKDNSGRYTRMDKVRKWCAKWADHYLIVRSPVGGIHFHGLAVRNGTALRYLKGIHLHIQPMGDKKERLLVEVEPSYPTHPLITDYHVSVLHMDVMRELRAQFGGPKTSLIVRIKARKARTKICSHRNTHVNNAIAYLRKNFFEGEGLPYDDIIAN